MVDGIGEAYLSNYGETLVSFCRPLLKSGLPCGAVLEGGGGSLLLKSQKKKKKNRFLENRTTIHNGKKTILQAFAFAFTFVAGGLVFDLCEKSKSGHYYSYRIYLVVLKI